jgi:hypothetical protein
MANMTGVLIGPFTATCSHGLRTLLVRREKWIYETGENGDAGVGHGVVLLLRGSRRGLRECGGSVAGAFTSGRCYRARRGDSDKDMQLTEKRP